MKIVKIVFYILMISSSILLFSTKWNYDNSGAFDTIATFLSITIGFTITALSIIATSAFSKNLYNLQDENDNSRTLLHVLINQFRKATFIFISTIALIILYKFLPKESYLIFNLKGYLITILVLIKSLVWTLTILSFLSFCKLFYTFSKFVTKSATV